MDIRTFIKSERAATLRLLGGMQGTVPNRILFSCPWGTALDLYYVYGSGLLEKGRTTWRLDGEGIILVHAEQNLVLKALGHPLRVLHILLGGTDVPDDIENSTAVFVPKQREESSSLAELFANLLEQLPDEKESLLLSELLTKLMLKTQSLPPAEIVPPDSICLLKEIFDTRYAEKLSLDFLAGELHWNKYKLEKDFKKHFSCSPFEYLLNVRMRTACRLLCETKCSVLEIGNAVGIENASYFIRIFKRQTGMSPLDYRKHYSVSMLHPGNHYSV